MALTSGTRLGPYEIVDQIGAGGMGEVHVDKENVEGVSGRGTSDAL